ncbi:MAG: RNA polymerase sigma factor [Betaproteobacteria bacterium]|nr:RNA polymerase sigma factor [Betaproteobacteria bacterium]
MELATTLEQARQGDRQAQGALLTRFQNVWFRFALAQLHDADLAADATQETALRFLRQLPTYRGQSQLQTWSLGIALNVIRECRRRRSENLDGTEAQIAAGGDPTERVELQDERSRVQSALKLLSARQREVLLLRYFEDLSTEQTATAMNCAPGTVKATLHQALRALKAKLAAR